MTDPTRPELPERLQRYNSLVFIVNTSITYLVAPVFYVGVHAAILSELGFSDTIANLPTSVNCSSASRACSELRWVGC